MKDQKRKGAYPIVISKEPDETYFETIPDIDIFTHGQDVADAMEMARDAIGLMGIDLEDDGKKIPEPGSVKYSFEKGDIVTLVDVDFAEYRKKVDNRAVKKNCTIPYWLNVEAERAGVNFSKLLQEAIINTLGLTRNKVN